MAFADYTDHSSDAFVGVNWFDVSNEDMYKPLSSLVRNLDRQYTNREMQLNRNIQFYTNLDPSAMNPLINASGAMTYSNTASAYRENMITWNICKSAVDTIAAKISKNKIKTMVTTEGAPYFARKKAQQLDKAVSSIHKTAGVQKKLQQAFRDSLIMGDGMIQVIDTPEGPQFERVTAKECFVDPLEGILGTPQCFYRYKFIDRQILLKLYPKRRHEIMKAPKQKLYTQALSSDLVLVYEAWRKGKDGKHCICLDTCTLFVEDYKEDVFPFVFVKCSELPYGFWSQSIVDDLSRIQMEINKVLGFIQKAIQLNHAPKWLINNANPLPPGSITNQMGAVVKYNGQAPGYIAPQPINEQVIQYVQMLKTEAYAIAGISELSSRSQKPAGLNSGKALQTFNDIESERFVLLGQAFENAFVDLFKLTVASCKRTAETNPDFSIVVHDKKHGNKVINWNDIDIEKDKYFVSLFPVSALPQSPEARLEYINNLVDTQKISNDDAIELLDMPDLESFLNRTLAVKNSIDAAIERMIESGQAEQLDELDDPNVAYKTAHLCYLEMKANNAPQSTLDVLRSYIANCESVLIQIKQAQEAQAQAPQPQMPQ